MPYIVSITEIENPDPDCEPVPPVEHYRRRVDLPDVATTIRAIDAALSVKPRKPRSDAGSKRPTQTSA